MPKLVSTLESSVAQPLRAAVGSDFMPELRANGPYVWPTWLTALLAGEASCEWRAWFHVQHDSRSWVRVRDGDDASLTQWRIRHTELLRTRAEHYEGQGCTVTIEGQNDFMVNFEGATISGKPDLVAWKDGEVIIEDAKTGQPHASHQVQVMLYMLLLRQAQPRFADASMRGVVSYPDHEVDVPTNMVDEFFEKALRGLVGRLAAPEPARKVPSAGECRFCPIGRDNCPERVEFQPAVTG